MKSLKVNDHIMVKIGPESHACLDAMKIPIKVMGRGGVITQTGPAGVSFITYGSEREWHLGIDRVDDVLERL